MIKFDLGIAKEREKEIYKTLSDLRIHFALNEVPQREIALVCLMMVHLVARKNEWTIERFKDLLDGALDDYKEGLDAKL